jgi:hypothetical protein
MNETLSRKTQKGNPFIKAQPRFSPSLKTFSPQITQTLKSVKKKKFPRKAPKNNDKKCELFPRHETFWRAFVQDYIEPYSYAKKYRNFSNYFLNFMGFYCKCGIMSSKNSLKNRYKIRGKPHSKIKYRLKKNTI